MQKQQCIATPNSLPENDRFFASHTQTPATSCPPKGLDFSRLTYSY